MTPNSSLIVSSSEPQGKNRKKVWIQKGKNLFDGKFENKTVSSDGIILDHTARLKTTNLIKVEPNSYYTISISNSNVETYIFGYDADKNFIDAIVTDWNKTFPYTFQTGENIQYIYLVLRYSDNSDIGINDIKSLEIESGSEITEKRIYVKNSNDVYEEFMKKEKNTDWMKLVTGISYRKIGADVELNIKYIQNIAMANNTWVTIATLPVGYRPKLSIYIPVMIMNTSNVLVYSILAIDPDGKLSFKQATGNNITGTDCRAFSRFSTL